MRTRMKIYYYVINRRVVICFYNPETWEVIYPQAFYDNVTYSA